MDSSPEVGFFALNGTWPAFNGRDALVEFAKTSLECGGIESFALAHNVHSEAEVNEVIVQGVRVGTIVMKEPEKVSWGSNAGYFAVPDGHLWEVVHNPFFMGETPR